MGRRIRTHIWTAPRRWPTTRSLDAARKPGLPRTVGQFRPAAICILAGLVLLVGPGAQAMAQFTAPKAVSKVQGFYPEVAVAPAGQAVVVWGRGFKGGTRTLIKARTITKGGKLGTFRTIGEAIGGDTYEVAVDSKGRATVVWLEPDRDIRVVRLNAAGKPGQRRTVGHGKGGGVPEIAVDPGGRSAVVWATKSEVEGVRINAAGNPAAKFKVSKVATTASVGAEITHLSIEPNGRATVVWKDARGTLTRRIDTAGNRGPIQALALPGDPSRSEDVAVDQQGQITFVWKALNADGDIAIFTSGLDPEGNPRPTREVCAEPTYFVPNGACSDGHVLRVAVDAQGRATVAWISHSPPEIRAARLDAEGEPGEIRTAAPHGGGSPAREYLLAAVDPQGQTTLVYNQSGIGATRLDPDGNPLTSDSVSAGIRDCCHQMAVDEAGRATVVWEELYAQGKVRVMFARF